MGKKSMANYSTHDHLDPHAMLMCQCCFKQKCLKFDDPTLLSIIFLPFQNFAPPKTILLYSVFLCRQNSYDMSKRKGKCDGNVKQTA